jgi:hypothetical protein
VATKISRTKKFFPSFVAFVGSGINKLNILDPQLCFSQYSVEGLSSKTPFLRISFKFATQWNLQSAANWSTG